MRHSGAFRGRCQAPLGSIVPPSPLATRRSSACRARAAFFFANGSTSQARRAVETRFRWPLMHHFILSFGAPRRRLRIRAQHGFPADRFNGTRELGPRCRASPSRLWRCRWPVAARHRRLVCWPRSLRSVRPVGTPLRCVREGGYVFLRHPAIKFFTAPMFYLLSRGEWVCR